MKDHQQIHLLSTYTTFQGYVEEIEALATRGQLRAGDPRSAPLPPEVWAQVQDHLQEGLRRMRQMAETYAADRLAQREGAPGLGATRMAISARLGEMQDLLTDLRPERFGRKYGDLSPEEAQGLAALLEAIQAALRAAEESLSREAGEEGCLPC